MTRKSLFGPHLYSQIFVPLIVASFVVSVVASVVAMYFLGDLTNKWVDQVANATASSAVQQWREADRDRRSYLAILSADERAAAAADALDEPTLGQRIVADCGLLPPDVSLTAIDRSGIVVASGGTSPVSTGAALPGLPDDWTKQTRIPAVYTSENPVNLVTTLGWAGTKHNYAFAVTMPVDRALLNGTSHSLDGGSSFYSPTGDRLATVVSAALGASQAAAVDEALRDAHGSIAAAVRGAAQHGGTGSGTFTAAGVSYRYLVRRAADAQSPPEAADGYVVSAVSEIVSQDAARTSQYLIVTWSLAAIAAFILMGFWVARRVSDPLVELAEGARRIADGDFTTKVDVQGGNELAILGTTFNDMTDSLRERSETLTKKVLELAMLYEMSRALGSTLDMDELLGSTLDSALRIFDLDVGYVALRDRDTGALEIRAVRGADIPDAAAAKAVRSSMADWVVREGRPLIFNPDPNSADGQVDALTGAKAALCVPLVSAEGTIGAITVGSSDAEYRFNSDDVRLLSTIGNHVTIAVGNIELFSSLQDAYLATVRSLAAAVDAKDTYTRGHSDKVALYATLVAQRMGLSHDQLTALEMAAYLHDIGKIGVPEEILLKPGMLDDDEMAQMRHHPLIGANILKPVAFPWAITPIVRHHHEYWDGHGYPAGLKGEEIPLLARILCVADSFEAITADRPYRAGRSAREAVLELQACAGTQFDPRVVEVMLEVVEELERTGEGVSGEPAEEITVEEARAIFAALVDGVLASFRRLGGPRLASNVESDIDEYFTRQSMPFRMVRSRLSFTEDAGADLALQLDDMRSALRHIDAMIGRVSGGTLVQHFYDDALEGFSARMRQLAIMLEFAADE